MAVAAYGMAGLSAQVSHCNSRIITSIRREALFPEQTWIGYERPESEYTDTHDGRRTRPATVHGAPATPTWAPQNRIRRDPPRALKGLRLHEGVIVAGSTPRAGSGASGQMPLLSARARSMHATRMRQHTNTWCSSGIPSPRPCPPAQWRHLQSVAIPYATPWEPVWADNNHSRAAHKAALAQHANRRSMRRELSSHSAINCNISR